MSHPFHWDPSRSSSNFCHRPDLRLKWNPANHVPQRSDKLLGSHSSSRYVNFLPHNRCTTLSAFIAASNLVQAQRLVGPPAVGSAAHRHFGDSEEADYVSGTMFTLLHNLREEFPGSCTIQNDSSKARKLVLLLHFSAFTHGITFLFLLVCGFQVYGRHGHSPFFSPNVSRGGPPALDSRAPSQAGSPLDARSQHFLPPCLSRESGKRNLEHDPPKGFHSKFTQDGSLEPSSPTTTTSPTPPFMSHSLFNPDYLQSFC